MPVKQAAHRMLDVKTSHEAFAVKLQSFLGTQDDAIKRDIQNKRMVGMAIAAAGVGLGYLATRTNEDYVVFLFLGAVVLVVTGLFVFFAGSDKLDELKRAQDAQRLFAAMRADLHPRTVVKSRLDFSEATDYPHERTAPSPYSRAEKKWYRHPWLHFEWAFADGNLLALDLIDLVKTKSGAEIRRRHQVRGVLRVNDRVYRAVGKFRCEKLKVTSQPTKGGWLVWFGGYVNSLDDLLPELERLYRSLSAVRKA